MDISGLPIASTILGTAKLLVDPKVSPVLQPQENEEPEPENPKPEATTLTLTSYRRAPTVKADLSGWANRSNSSEIDTSEVRSTKASAAAWGSFARAKEDFNENPLIQRAMDKHDLSDKDWDFTVAKSGDIQVLEGNDKLSKDAVQSLEYALNHSEFGYEFKRMAENLIHASHAKREDSKYSFDDYNLTTENFSEVIKGRELMDTKRSDFNDLAFTISKQLDYAAEHSGLEEKVRYLVTRRINIEA